MFGGIASSLITSEMDIIYDLGIVSQFRGRDSTGVALAYHTREGTAFELMKAADHSSNFLWEPDVVDAAYKQGPFSLLGHCRAATKGEVNVENAHPFKVGHIIGAHNGTIHNLPDMKNGKTDSERLYEIMAEEGTQEAINAARHGAYALTWFDQKNNTFNILRNKERTLFLLRARGVLYWSSEYAMLQFIGNRHSVDIKDIRFVQTDTQYIYPLENPQSKWYTEVMAPKHIQSFIPPAPTRPVKNGDSVPFIPDPPKSKPTQSVPTVPLKKEARYEQNTTNIMFRAFKGKKMTLTKARHLLNEGCQHCTTKCPDNPHTKDMIPYFYNHKDYLCGACAASIDARAVCGATKLYKGELDIIVGECHGNC